jgi:hypothetical protein
MPADLDHFTPQACGKLAKQGIRGGPTGLFPVDLRLTTGDFRFQNVDPFFQFRHAEHLQILTDRLDEALTAANSDFRRLFHDELYLSGSTLGRYPTALSRRAQVCARSRPTALPEPST